MAGAGAGGGPGSPLVEEEASRGGFLEEGADAGANRPTSLREVRWGGTASRDTGSSPASSAPFPARSPGARRWEGPGHHVAEGTAFQSLG